jgi:hypothetical protein
MMLPSLNPPKTGAKADPSNSETLIQDEAGSSTGLGASSDSGVT